MLIDLNADLGEGAGHDAELMRWITSANICCGAHAGDALTMGDIPLGTSIHRWFNMEIERENLPSLAAYYKRLQARPAYQKALAKGGPVVMS